MLLSIGSASSQTLKITTWNLDWLSRRPIEDPALPADRPFRNSQDYRHISDALHRLASDIYAFQEVDGLESLTGLLPSDNYRLTISPAPIAQRVVLATRKRLKITVNPPLTALDIARSGHHHLREGLDVTVADQNHPLRILVVHLKSGCWEQPLKQTKYSCPVLYQQLRILKQWITQREIEGLPYLLIGDFNRRLTRSDPAFAILSEGRRLHLASDGWSSPCHGGEYFIDHFILGGRGQAHFSEGSLSVMTSGELTSIAPLSDHCPVSVKIVFGDTIAR